MITGGKIRRNDRAIPSTGIGMKRNHVFRTMLLLSFASAFLAGCAPFLQSEQSEVADWTSLSAGHTIGQTFVARFDGLTGVYFYLAPQTAGNGEIRLHLRTDSQAGEDFAVSLNVIPVEAVKDPGFYPFTFSSVASSDQKYYYAYLEFMGDGAVKVGRSAGSKYLDGASYRDGNSEDMQTAFQLQYSKRKAVMGMGLEFVKWFGNLLAGVFLFVLPGWGLFSLLWPTWDKLGWPEKLGLSAGLSLALYPIFMLWTDILGLHLGAGYAWVPPVIGVGLIVWSNRKRFKTGFAGVKILPPAWADVAYLCVTGLVILTRFWAIRSLDLPMFGDANQHTTIAQLMVNNGGLFRSWQPLAELTTFTYHYGFHSAVSVFHWVTSLDVPTSVLWVGQLLNILACLSLYPLAVKVGRSRWAGVAAVLVAGLFSRVPMYYVNWGRYTQLAGQVILPAVVWVAWRLFQTDPSSPAATGKFSQWKRLSPLLVGWLAMGGLALTHYRILILGLVFLVIIWIFYARPGTFKQVILQTAWLGLGAGILFLPWFLRVFGGRIIQVFAHQMATSAGAAVAAESQLAEIGNFSSFLPTVLWLAAVVVLGIGLWRREKAFLLVAVWWLGNTLVANPSWVGLPGAKLITSFTVSIAYYIPVAILMGAAAGWLMEWKGLARNLPFLRIDLRKILFPLLTIILLGTGIIMLPQRLKDVQPAKFALATRPDIVASAWIRANTPEGALLLVNSFPAFNNALIAGSDGGWWLSLLSGRKTSLPPFTYGFEKDPWPGYRVEVNALTTDIRSKGIQDPGIIKLLKDRGFSYVYIGQLQGMVNSGGPLFTPAQLLASPGYRLVYHQDRVWIFQVQ
jgi:hypothetical protein